MQAEFYREEAPDQVVGMATWGGSGVVMEAEDDRVRDSLARIFRPIPVLIDDPSLRSFGTAGPVQLAPGSLPWFRAAAEARATDEGLRVRLVPDPRGAMGWEPAGAYRTFNDQIERRELIGRPAPKPRRGTPAPA
jgi:hypothetical protein